MAATSEPSYFIDLSPLEQLPKELLAQIVGHVPEAVFEMRLTCRLLKSLVDDYARSPCDIPIVQRIAFTEKETGGVNAWLSVPKRRTALFEHRLRLHQPELKFRMERYFNGFQHPSQYCLELTSLPDDDIDGLRSCMGTTIRETPLPHYDEELAETIFNLLKGIKLERVNMFVDLQNESAARLLKNLRAHNVDELFLTVREVKLSNPTEFLLNLSSIVRSLLLTQLCIPDKELDVRHFLGIDDFDWALAIIGMFERRLDKMLIRNNYGAFLTLQSADAVRLGLPRLGRKIWFETQCTAYDNHEHRIDYVSNDHSIRVRRCTPIRNVLCIKHCSRESESLDEF